MKKTDPLTDIAAYLDKVKATKTPLRRQLLMVALISRLLKEQGKSAPVLIGGGALSYYSREVYFTADIDRLRNGRVTCHPVLC